MSKTGLTIPSIYSRLHATYGPQHWWPAKTPFEVIVGAILTQQAAWTNVEMAIENLRRENILEMGPLAKAKPATVEECIRPSGYFRQKTSRLLDVTRYLWDKCAGDLDKFFVGDTLELREELLSLKGIGQETADSILLYAANRPIFVIDAYTYRILGRTGHWKGGDAGVRTAQDYLELQSLIQRAIPPDARVYNEYHALFVEHAKRHCKVRPVCEECPLLPGCRKLITPKASGKKKK